MDKTVCMQHFDRTGNRQRLFDITAGNAAEFQHKHRADAFSAGRKAVVHRFKQPVIAEAGRSKILRKLRINKVFIFFCSHIIHQTGALPAHRPDLF